MDIVIEPKKENCVEFNCLNVGDCFVCPEDDNDCVYMIVESEVDDVSAIDLGSGNLCEFKDKELVELVETTLIAKRN